MEPQNLPANDADVSVPVSGGVAVEEKPSEPEKTTAQIMFVVPVELKELIDKRAESEGKSTSALMREVVADEFDYTLPLSIITRTKKYATPEERKAAQAEKNKIRNQLIARLLKAHRAGAINLGDYDLDDDEEDEEDDS